MLKDIKKERNRTIDVLKGIGIILMVIGHMHYSDSVEKFIFGFHMPLFFWVSGYLFRKPDSMATYFKGKAQGLLLPYAFFGVLYCIIERILHGKDAFITGLGGVFLKSTYDIPIESALWFLPALFWITIIYALIDRYVSDQRWRIAVVVVITVVGVYWTRIFHYLPYSINSAMSAMGFYELGRQFCEKGETKMKEFLIPFGRPLRILIWVGLVLLFGEFIMFNGFLNIRVGSFGIAPLGYLSAVVYTMLLFFLSEKLVQIKNISWLETIGRYSMVYLLTNHPMLILAKKVLTFFGMQEGTWSEMILEFILSMVMMGIIAQSIVKMSTSTVIGKND